MEASLPPLAEINYFKFARQESLKSDFRCRVGACIVIGKSVIRGFNKRKTHPIFANPNKHLKTSIHAELDCLSKIDFDITNGILYVYRETRDGNPAMSRPCEHCMKFLKETGIKEIFYSISTYPYYKKESL